MFVYDSISAADRGVNRYQLARHFRVSKVVQFRNGETILPVVKFKLLQSCQNFKTKSQDFSNLVGYKQNLSRSYYGNRSWRDYWSDHIDCGRLGYYQNDTEPSINGKQSVLGCVYFTITDSRFVDLVFIWAKTPS